MKEACWGPTLRMLESKLVGRKPSLLHGRGKGRKDKSRDVVANLEARLAKVELAMANTREGLDLIEQSMENGMKDLREQIQDLREGILISQIQPMSHEEFVLPRKGLEHSC
ncbi:hypothetical protein CK203_046700 [Vitis vinifera]|uniref:Uncharacterized protein n=1 Tax=Vitis vinifera TaxID=29760 RepID=A0A438HJS6_VITVI|nr:hypothetical protein CK203_046700 [Vitis vinifera]